MKTADEMNMLREQLVLTHEKYKRLTHPAVVRISQILDEKIMEHYREEKAAPKKH